MEERNEDRFLAMSRACANSMPLFIFNSKLLLTVALAIVMINLQCYEKGLFVWLSGSKGNNQQQVGRLCQTENEKLDGKMWAKSWQWWAWEMLVVSM